MKAYLLALGACFSTPVLSTFVVQCYSRLIDERADPVVSPGIASGHVHSISGGSGFNFTMNYTQAKASQCSTCNIYSDLSNYWTPKLYFHAQNGSFIDVPIIGDNSEGNMGGMAIYYLTRGGPDNDNLTAFPQDFRMLAGDSNKRNETDDFAGRAVSYKCVGVDQVDHKGLPTTKCDQIRAQITFPSCWDGKNLDSADHKSHMSYPKDGNYDGGRCPETHPVHMATLFYETYYDTKGFKDMWYGDSQPFVLANGDATGYGYHGDFVNGWEVDALQIALQNCTDSVDTDNGSDDCVKSVFGVTRNQTQAQECKIPSYVPEPVSGILSALPGCNPVTYGPGPASPPKSCAAPGLAMVETPMNMGYTDVTKKGYKYIGCGIDDAGSRTLGVAQTSSDDMTVETCIDFCKGKGTKYAGLVYSGECYCGNDVAENRAPVKGLAGNCLMKCSGDKNEVCGGAGAISLYEVCGSGTCSNLARRESLKMLSVEKMRADAAS